MNLERFNEKAVIVNTDVGKNLCGGSLCVAATTLRRHP